MSTIFYTATTLDGYLADEHDSLDWLFVQDIDQEGPMNYDAFIANVGATVMGLFTPGSIWIFFVANLLGGAAAGLLFNALALDSA